MRERLHSWPLRLSHTTLPVNPNLRTPICLFMHHSISFILKYTNPLVQRLLTQSLKKVNQSLEDPTTVFTNLDNNLGKHRHFII